MPPLANPRAAIAEILFRQLMEVDVLKKQPVRWSAALAAALSCALHVMNCFQIRTKRGPDLFFSGIA